MNSIKVLATYQKATKDGGVSIWRFCETPDGQYFALRGNGRVIPCKNLEELRKVCVKWKSYGFTLVTPDAPATPEPEVTQPEGTYSYAQTQEVVAAIKQEMKEPVAA